MTADEIWEERICDSLGDMNIFADVNDLGEFMEGILPDIKKAASQNKAPTQTRGSPDGKASRETNKAKKKGKITKYLPEMQVGKSNMEYIRHQLMKLYSGVSDGIADGIPIEQGNKVYIVDSGRDNGKLDFGVRRMRTLSADIARKEFIRSAYDKARSKGDISDEILGRVEYGERGDLGRNLRRELGGELQTDTRESENQQVGVSQKDANGKRGISSEYSSPEEAKASGKASQELDFVDFAERMSAREVLANAFESVAQSDIEKTKLKEYKENIAHYDAEEAKLKQLRAEIKELSFATGERDTPTIRRKKSSNLSFSAKQKGHRGVSFF